MKRKEQAGLKGKSNSNNRSNLIAAASGIAAAYTAIFFAAPILRYFYVMLLVNSENHLVFNWLFLTNDFQLAGSTPSFKFISIQVSPILTTMVWIEIGNILLLKSIIGFKRFLLIAYQIFNFGFLLFWVVAGVLTLYINPASENALVKIFNFLSMDQIGKIIFTFAVMIITFVYLNISMNRIKKYIILPKQF